MIIFGQRNIELQKHYQKHREPPAEGEDRASMAAKAEDYGAFCYYYDLCGHL